MHLALVKLPELRKRVPPILEPLGWPLHCLGSYQIHIIQKPKTLATHVLLKHV